MMESLHQSRDKLWNCRVGEATAEPTKKELGLPVGFAVGLIEGLMVSLLGDYTP
jgi:hypothetical protein